MTDWPFSILVAQNYWEARVQAGTTAAVTAARYRRVFEAFCRYAAASGVADASGATDELVGGSSRLPTRNDRSPTGSTASVRMAAIRDAFDGLVEAGLAAENPTCGLRVDREPACRAFLPADARRGARLLTAGRLFPTDTLRPASVALALAGATHVEVARAVVADLDPRDGGLRLGAGSKSERTIFLVGPATEALRARVTRSGGSGVGGSKPGCPSWFRWQCTDQSARTAPTVSRRQCR